MARAPEVTVVTVGDTAVGKTALIQRFCNDTFPQVTLSTNTGQKGTCNYKLTETSKRFGKYAIDHFLRWELLLDSVQSSTDLFLEE